MNKSRILVVDDDKFARVFCREILEEEEVFEVSEAPGVDEAIDLINQGGIDLVVTDMVMPEKSGLDLIDWARKEMPGLEIIVITGHGTVESAVKAMKLGALDYIRKPLNPPEFKIVVHRAIDKIRLAQENRELKSSLKLHNIGSRITRTIEIEELYELIFDLLMQETGATRGFLYLLDQEQGESNVIASEGFDVELNDSIDSDVFTAYTDVMSSAVGPVIPEKIASLQVKFRTSVDHIRSIIFIPLRNKKDLVGMVVFFDTEREGAFTERDTHVAAFLSEHAGAAIENALLYSQAKILTITDDLTNVFNYRYLNNILDRELLRAQRLNTHMSILFLDLDSFKQVNDKHGHLVGSKILIEMAGILKQAVRKVDAVARYGGDEYIVVLTDTTSGGARIVAERIRETVESYVFMREEGYNIRLTISIGVASYPEHATGKIELLHLADEAMYRGKFGRKNVVYIAAPERTASRSEIEPENPPVKDQG